MKILEYFCPDFAEWPESWHGVEEEDMQEVVQFLMATRKGELV